MKILLLVLALSFAAVDTPGRAGDLECEKIKQMISRIQSKMRSGYSRAEGERLEAELRRLRALRRKACR